MVLIIAPTLVVMTAALHGFAASERKPFALLAVVFMASAALVTAGVHATILSLGTEAIAAHPRWLSFTWPSAVYALDILAWDRFFALAVLFGAAALPGRGAAVYAKWLLFASGLLSSFGLIGALMGEMTIRNIGIIGYCGFFPAAAVAMAFLFARSEPHGDTRG